MVHFLLKYNVNSFATSAEKRIQNSTGLCYSWIAALPGPASTPNVSERASGQISLSADGGEVTQHSDQPDGRGTLEVCANHTVAWRSSRCGTILSLKVTV